MAAIIQLPHDVARLRAGRDAVHHRAAQVGASPARRRAALRTLLAELQAGRSPATAVASANSTLRAPTAAALPGGAT